jgi:hypothetical protein
LFAFGGFGLVLIFNRCSRARGASPRPVEGFHLSLGNTEMAEESFPQNVLATLL